MAMGAGPPIPSLAAPSSWPSEAGASARQTDVRGPDCEFWVDPSGDDGGPGTQDQPWRTIQHAVDEVPDRGCTVWFNNGVYRGGANIERAFDERTIFRAVNPYRAALEHDGQVLDISGGARITFRGFDIRHSGPGASEPVMVYVYGTDTHHITLRNNIIHDSFNNDLLKILDGPRSVVVRGNVFYNQGDGEEHIDANSVTNVTIVGNIFFNDFSRSGRENTRTTKHYIVVKDSNEDLDGMLGSRHVTIGRNIFLNWEGVNYDAFIAIGLDGKPYYEARDVQVENNLMIGNVNDDMDSALHIFGARDVDFVNNTVVGDLPTRAYAFRIDVKDNNPQNRHIRFSNNIWCDPTGTMDEFADGEPSGTTGLSLNNNLYWNDGERIPGGDLVSPRSDDARHVFSDPRLNADQSGIELPFWTGSEFLSGNATIRAEFVRLVEAYGLIPAGSPAVGRAIDSLAPGVDILGRKRDGDPDLGAFES